MHIKRRELLFAGLSSAALGMMTEPAMAIAAPTGQQ
ncbi:alpha/beta hydrolase, partial [Escherichia coli]